MKLVNIFTVRIVYKSGYTHDFDVTKFTIKGSTYVWESANDSNKPIQLGANDIVAVYQVGMRKKLVWGKQNAES
jgi:hypothetical protein